MKKIIQIVPTYPPNIGGIGHYAKLLAYQLIKKGINSKFLVSDLSDCKITNNVKLFGKKTLKLSNLLENYNSKEIILHFSGYGFATKGLCFGLIKSIKDWKNRDKKNKLITIFHEIYAKGSIFKSSFWTYLPQKYLAKNLFKLSDISVTSNKENQLILSSFEKSKKVKIFSTFSNIGEIKYYKSLNKRNKIAIIFGGSFQKKILYEDIYLKERRYYNLLREFSIKQIIDVGPKVVNLKKIINIPIKAIGIKSKKFISNLFSKAKVGLIFYPISQMPKSGIVAAYASHGILIINFCEKKIYKNNEFINGLNFVSDNLIKKNLNYQKIADKSNTFYKKNNINNITNFISCYIKKNNIL